MPLLFLRAVGYCANFFTVLRHVRDIGVETLVNFRGFVPKKVDLAVPMVGLVRFRAVHWDCGLQKVGQFLGWSDHTPVNIDPRAVVLHLYLINQIILG